MPGKRSSKDGNVAIYVFWSEKRTLDTNTISYLQELLDVAELVLFVSNSPLDPLDVSKIKALGVSLMLPSWFCLFLILHSILLMSPK